jgi:FtsH-binding integral membrane protein
MNRQGGFGASNIRSRADLAAEQTRFLVRVYNWMGSGLALTGLVAWYVAQSETLVYAIVGNPLIFFGLIIAELGAVFYLSARVMKMSATRATTVFLGYAVLNGLTLSVIFLAYTQASITKAFLVTAIMFGSMSLYGATTKKDLSAWGSFLFMGLIGLIAAMFINFFFQSSMMDFVISCVGVLIFTGLTAYDTQKILAMNILGNEGTEEDTKEAISGALRLYLDFINLFLMLLRLMGDRR